MVETNTFQDIVPEHAGVPPIKRLRLLECYRLAEAYKIPYPLNCKKEQIMPTLEQAEAAGMFLKPPEDPELLLPPGQRKNNGLKLVKTDVAPKVDDAPKSMEYQGPQLKYCIMQGDKRIESGLTKEEAEARV